MEVVISIPDEVFAEAEELTQRLGMSRSQLYSEAVREYLLRYDQDAVTAAFNDLSEQLDTHTDPAVSAASQVLLKKVEW
jgi:metal-responsive CopG/Arc/MetJ family transcriptional regulator